MSSRKIKNNVYGSPGSLKTGEKSKMSINLKELIKTSLQNNLNKDYIRKILNVIASRPTLHLAGSAFSSISDKYLNIFSLKSLKYAYSGKYPVAYGSLFLPYELFHGLGVTPFLPEVVAGYAAGLGLADKALKKAASNWYSQDLCTFHRCGSGAVELDLFPQPKFIICTNLACDAAQKSFYIYAKLFNIEENFYLVDIPYSKNKKAILYLSEQLKEISTDISKKLGKKMNLNKLKKAVEYSNTFREWVIKVNDLRKNLLHYPPNFNGLNFILPFHAFAGTQDNITLYQKMYFELSKYLKMQKEKENREYKKDRENIPGLKKNPKKPVKRILWLHLKPYYKNDIFSILENENLRVVFEEINQVYWPALDPQNPFESLAEKMLSHFLNGSIENRLNKILNIIKEYKIDGTILFSHWGCRQNNGASRIVKDTLKEHGQPVLILDGDCVDRNNFPEGQLKTRLQGFIEILNSNSKQ